MTSSSSRLPLDRDRLKVSLPWTSVEVVDEVDSTNSAIAGRAPGSVLVAEYQNAGRGRLGRSWVMPPRAGVIFSVLLRPQAPPSRWGWLPLLAGLAVCDVIDSAVLKWPNDVLIGPSQRKLAGILSQASGSDVIIGIGLNVTTTRAELPVETATSLELEGHTPDRTDLLGRLLAQLGQRVRDWDGAGGPGLGEEYTGRCSTLGQLVRVHGVDGSTLDGEAVGVDDIGRLVVSVDGTPTAIAAGDVEHVRPVTR